MKYNFDELVERRNTNSYKWDSCAEGVIPMWVADMDFKTAPCVVPAETCGTRRFRLYPSA